METEARFEELYEEGFAAVYRAALVSSGDRDVAEEASQEAFARALERWDRIGGEPWAVGWVVSTALNIVRRRHRWSRPIPAGPRRGDQDVDASLDLWRAIRSLPRRQQQAVTLHYVADLPLEQVARVMGCRNGTVKAHLWRARQRLANELGDHRA